MALSAEQLDELTHAMLSAFGRSELYAMVRQYLGRSLSAMGDGPGDLNTVIVNLVKWAEQHACVADLLMGATRCKPVNARLTSFIANNPELCLDNSKTERTSVGIAVRRAVLAHLTETQKTHFEKRLNPSSMVSDGTIRIVSTGPRNRSNLTVELPKSKVLNLVAAVEYRRLEDIDAVRVELMDADLSDTDLQGANLSGANLSWTNLRGADLRRANLSGADLTGAALSHAVLDGANLEGANLRKAILTEAKLVDAYLRGANLEGAELLSANLSDADLRDAYLGEANLRDADLSRADLTGAYLGGASLIDAHLQEVNLTDANKYLSVYSQDERSHVDFGGAMLCGAKLCFATFSRVNFSGALLIEADFFHASINEANFSNANLSRAYLSNAFITNADFTGADLSDACLDSDLLHSTNLTGGEPPSCET
ncbi:MAG: pentapeptide repeat-containing protein [Caldilineaceae bacterium]